MSSIIDVRTPQEYMGGHVVGSINIPLSELPTRIDDIREMAQPIILCCASGMRSGQAMLFLKQRGIECVNGGSWLDVQSKMK